MTLEELEVESVETSRSIRSIIRNFTSSISNESVIDVMEIYEIMALRRSIQFEQLQLFVGDTEASKREKETTMIKGGISGTDAKALLEGFPGEYKPKKSFIDRLIRDAPIKPFLQDRIPILKLLQQQ